ncbi:TonB-linked outer membrane protein, SusC/RagA family [Arachidicoccus rhizosphaerae]|jgi:TonB-linked SusC/RagA family outer membrane protein|uniref:TonB-linked outer membrane protein, SusC/RagA family n=1 Tax=Arachidicoccus rhizosphaerae TaxID=551991 RepID=A0A1H3Y1Q9_9BACT|nr:TonB-dependent receptor [Arachidicoccus rhizosphaerae]SEA05513.1 TonB-linked outer membrane protein, SusC/RagA family [Arachidicoccus rhizosphaerae]
MNPLKLRQKYPLRSLVLLLTLLVFSNLVQAQSTEVSGQITNTQGQPLNGATISVKNTQIHTLSDAEGHFTIQVPDQNTQLVIDFVGYNSQQIDLNGRSHLSIELTQGDQSLSDVVVIGYGTVKKSDLTGSVASIESKDLTKGTNINMQQALQGRVAGVQIYQKSGEPGAAMSVQIRGITSITGNNAPLYVIDGMPVNDAVAIGSASPGGTTSNPNDRNPLNTLNPSDIASIEILKDASATAIYGSRGANGVVLITTKKGGAGNLKVSYDGSYGRQQVSHTQKYMTGDQYTEALNGIIKDGNLNTSNYPEVTGDNYNTDWQQLLFRKASIQSHDISFSGGNPTTKYYVSAGYFGQDGVMLKSGTQRYNVNVHLDINVPQKYNVGVSLATSYMKDQYNATGTGLNDNGSALYMAQNYDPTAPAYNEDGSYYRSPLMAPMDNPLAVINGQYSTGETYRTFGNLHGEYFFAPTFSAKVRVGADVNDAQRYFWIDPSTLTGASYNGYADVRDGKRGYYLLEGTFNYNESFGKHKINAVAGATYEKYTSSSLVASARSFALADLTYYALGTGDQTLNEVGNGKQENILISYLGRVNYSYLDRYLLTASIRADGSARFGPQNRYGYFPSAALSWKIKQESFMKNVDAISDLKLRASYGAIGNQPNSNYLYLSTYAAGRDAVFDGQRVSSIAPSRSPNVYLQWESARQTDIGLDFSLFSSKLSGTIDYYNRKTFNLLYDIPLPLSSGFGSQTQNVGSMRNQGIEFALNSTLVDQGDFKLDASFNITTLKNKILSLGGQDQVIASGPGSIGDYSILKPGESMGSYYGYVVTGVWQTSDDFTKAPAGVRPGDLKYKDLDSNQVIDGSDRVILGNSLPDFYYGFNVNASYKGLSLNVSFEGSHGAKMLNSSLVDSYYPVDFRRNKLADLYLNRWTPENPTNEYPSFIPGDVQGLKNVTNKTVEGASYLRLQSVQLSYNVPLGRHKFINSATVYISGQNLWTITNYSGADPAANAIGSNINKVDYNTYPMTRTFTGGLNIQF